MGRIVGLIIETEVKKGGKRTPKSAAAKPEKEDEHGETGNAEAQAGNR